MSDQTEPLVEHANRFVAIENAPAIAITAPGKLELLARLTLHSRPDGQADPKADFNAESKDRHTFHATPHQLRWLASQITAIANNMEVATKAFDQGLSSGDRFKMIAAIATGMAPIAQQKPSH